MAVTAGALNGALANDWLGGVGDWSNAANWNGGIPNDSGGWAIGSVTGGTAIVSTTIPHVSEAWAGNFGGAGTIIVTNGGTLSVDNWLVVARMCCPSPTVTPLSTLIVDGGTINKTGDGFIVGDSGGGQGSTAELIVRGNSVVNVTGGWNGFGSGANSRAWVTLQDNIVYNTPGYDFNIADYGAAKVWCYLKDNATLNASRFWIAKSDTTVGTLWQTGGTINGTGAAANEWTIGGDGSAANGSFGFYSLAAGSITCPFNFQVGRYGGGVIYQSGGTNIQSGWTSIGRYSTGSGAIWVSKGRFSHQGTGSHLIVGEEGRGTLTLSGTASLDTLLNVRIGNAATANGFVSLNGGTAVVAGFTRANGNGYLNFNGTVVQATQDDPNFISNLTEARIYAGNAIFDTAGHDVQIPQSLLGATGQGVISIPVSSGGQDYVAPPIVTIDGDGFGALALAQIDPTAGTVTNLLVTCPGHDYTTVYSVTITGGGASVAATAGTPVLGAVASGGVTKNGAGSLALLGQDTYTGPTVVNAGKLIVTGNASGTPSYTVADGATLGITVPNPGLQVMVPNVTLGSSAGASLDFDLGNTGNPFLAPLAVSGAITLNGTVTVNIADALPQVGQFTLAQFGSKLGTGTFKLGTLPVGVQATLVTTATALQLQITAVNLPRWDGQAGGFWDINVTANWTDISTGLPTFYGDGNAVQFDDNALGTTTVNLVTNVKPASIVVTNAILSYSLTGTGKISGATGLLKQGTNSFTIANSAANDYTGPTTISGGTLFVTNLANGGQASAIGKSSSDSTNLVISGTLSYSGPAAASDRGYRVGAAGAAIDIQGDLSLAGKVTAVPSSSFVKRGPATLTYKTVGTNELSGGSWPGYNVTAGNLVFDGSAGYQTNHSQNEFWVASTPDVPGSMVLTNTNLRIDSWLAVGRGNGTSGTLSSLSIYNSKLWSGSFSMGYANGIAGNLASQVFTISGNSTFTNNGDWNFGESGGSSSSLTMKDNAIIDSGRFFIGWHSGTSGSGTGAVVMANSTLLNVRGWLSIGNEGGVGSLLMKDSSSLHVDDFNVTDVNTGDGTCTIQDNASLSASQVYVAKGVGSTGTFNQSGGTVTGRTGGGVEFQIGTHGPGTWNQTGGTVNANNHWTSIGRYTDGTGILNISGGSFNHNDPTKWLQVGEQGNGTLNVSGTGLVTTVGSQLLIANATGSSGTINLNGGAIIAKRVAGGGGLSMFNFNGGTLVAGPGANLDFMSGIGSVYVLAGGAVINSSNNIIGITQPLWDGGGNGGLTKLGTGVLALNGTNSYTGPTLINAGTLAGTGVIVSPVTVASGAFLAPGTNVGALSISNTLTLAAGSTTVIEIDKANGVNDLVQGVTTVTYGGTLVLTNLSAVAMNDTFKIFQAGSYTGSFSAIVSNPGTTWDTSRLNIDGTVKVLGTVSTTPVSVGVSTASAGTELVFSWPQDHLGWRLLTQTNNLNLGVSANSLDWGTVAGSTSTNQVYLPIDKSKPAGFYRLVYP